ncbi:MAG: prolipoprotein diacylglyceryl transferase [Candidatus Omnitrophica bacterium]|nr:prolipoprotein diacylglyceryl transferase [Candidatus Omnitrophota bacterium]
MHPVIFKFGPITIYSYGLMIFIAVIVCFNLLSKEAKRLGYDKDAIFDLGFVILFSGIIGARLLYVLLNLGFYLKNPKEIFMFAHGGLAIFGGIIVATIVAFVFMKFKRLPFFSTLDLIAPFVALGQSIGRIGCLLNGCCYGFPCKIGFYFPVHDAVLFPTQLLSSFLLLVLYIVLRVGQGRPHATGMIFTSYILYYSVMRFFIEFIRADSPRLFLNLTIFQYFSFVLFVFGLILSYGIKWKKRISK